MSLPPSSPDPAPSPGGVPALPPAFPALRSAWRAALGLMAFTAVFTALMAFTHEITREPVRAAVAEQQMRLIDEVLPRMHYDNDLLADMIEVGDSGGIVGRIWRARRGGEPVALVFETFASDGYGGRIEIIAALDTGDDRLRGARVAAHRETPGLGDYIDPAKDRNKAHPWIAQFSGAEAGRPPERWAVRKDGGDFDYRTGATVSARAVTHALGRGLAWINPRRDTLFAVPAGTRLGADGQPAAPPAHP